MSLQSTWSCIRPSAAGCRVPTPSRAAAAFSTTPSRCTTPPESPTYIRLPTVPQSSESKPERVRGTLPVPRDIFPRTDGDRKIQPSYIAQTAPQRTRPRDLTTETQRWKKEVADSRRRNLEEGLQGLWARHGTRVAQQAERKRREQRVMQRAHEAGEREEDRVTRGTVLEAIRDTAVRPDPERFERAERSRARVLAQEGVRREARRDALMELYINAASGFIVTEAELKAEVDRVFAEDYFRKASTTVYRPGATENVWGVYGKPPGVATMLENLTRTSTNLAAADISEYDHSVKRTKRISEELTGGKMT